MTSLYPPSFDGSRRPSVVGMHSSPASSPIIQRPASQQSFHLPAGNTYSPDLGNQAPFSAYPTQPQTFRAYQPPSISLPGPNTYLGGGYPTTAPPLAYFPNTAAPLYDPRGSQQMMRTISHAHPMNSATDRTVSSRYSSSPHSATGPLIEASPTASGQQLNPYPGLGIHQQPAFTISNADDQDQQRMVNPTIFATNGYPMSRSTSGASDTQEVQRLMTPGFDMNFAKLSPGEQELRKVSDTLGDPTRRYYPSAFTPSFDLQSHAFNLGPHPQPNGLLYAGRGHSDNDHFNMSSERIDLKPDLQLDTEYERERQAQILNNRKLLGDIGLGGGGGFTSRSRSASSFHSTSNRKASTIKKRLPVEAPVRASPRLREMSRTVSYADLDGGPRSDSGEEQEEEYNSDAEPDEEEDFRPSKRSKGRQGFRVKSASYTGSRSQPKVALSLYGLLQTYGDIPHLFPLFYYTLNNDLTINSDSVPLIGSIPSTCSPLEKADMLQNFFHRGKRVQAQIDAFTSRCDKKYEGADVKWPELDYHTRIAIRDVRRKVVERCENYKYTRRDILDKVVGKNKWHPIENGMIEWHAGMTNNDPAKDLINVQLTLPTPPPAMYSQQIRSASSYSSSRTIKPLPSGGRSRIVSSAPRTVSVTMGEPGSDDYMLGRPQTATYSSSSSLPIYTYPTSAPPPPMYGEDQVPMTVQLAAPSVEVSANGQTSWENNQDLHRAIKRSRSDESASPDV